MVARLAINDGTPVRTKPFPTYANASGRDFGAEEKQLLSQVIDSGSLNRIGGRMVARFESEFAALHGVSHATAVTSGTAALHVAVGALDLEPGDEVITSAVSDPGSIIGILLCNAIPIFTDVDRNTGNLLPAAVESQITSRTKAIMVVHLSGRPAPMDNILAIANRHGLATIEDCAQSHLAEYKGRLVGTIGDMGAFSFQQSKQMTTGDGGIVVTSNETLAGRARLYADKAWPRETAKDHLFLAPNYRMTELQGAVGLAQVGKLPSIVARRRASASALILELQTVPGIRPALPAEYERPSWWTFPVWIDRDVLNVTPATFRHALAAEGIPCQVGFMPRMLLDYTFIKERRTYGQSRCPWSCPHARQGIEYRQEDYPNASAAVSEPIVIPWNEGIGANDVRDVAEALSKLSLAFQR